MTKRYLTIPAMVAGALGLGASASFASEPTNADLLKQIESLQSKVSQLETKQSVTTQAVNETVEKVLRDADKRSQLLDMEGFTGGYSNGRFGIGSADGNNTFMPMAQFQFRSVNNFEFGGDDDDNSQHGFDLRRVKFGFDGNIVNKDLYYYFLWSSNNGSSGLSLEQAWAQWKMNDSWSLRFGQVVDPTFHEHTVSSKRQLAADRSLAINLISGSNEPFTQMASLVYMEGQVKAELGFTDGFGTGNEDWQDFPANSADFGVVGRVDFAINGGMDGAGDFTGAWNKEEMAILGGGVHWTQAGDTDTFVHGVDFQWENTEGLGVYLAYMGNFSQNNATDDDTYNWGALAQVGYLMNENWEPFARYNYTSLDDDIAVGGGSEDTFHEFTGGVNYYFTKSHNAKVTVDVSWLTNGAPSNSGLGHVSSDEDQVVIRGQFQLLI